jgi:hypothetical protein
MRRRLAAVTVTAVTMSLLTTSVPAMACERATSRGTVRVCPEQETDGDPEHRADQVDQSWTPPDDWVLSEWSAPGREDDGTPCIEQHRQWMHEDDHAAHIGMRNYGFFRWYDRLTWDGDTLEECEQQPDAPGLPPQLVLEAIETQLPLPEPSIQPGWALTGLPSYLEIGAPAAYSDEVAGGVLPVVVSFEATARYRVDWGDGHVSEHDSAGGPYPDGDVTYTYADAVDRTVTVTPIWTITATGNGQTFTFPDVELVSSEVELPVRELQSVRTTGR